MAASLPILPLESGVPTAPHTYTHINNQGLYEVIDLITGNILCVQRTPKDLLALKFENLVKIETPEGVVWIEKGIDVDKINFQKPWPFSKILGDLICQRLVEGVTTLKACEEFQIPYSLFVRWKREFPEFGEQLEQAKKDRAEAFHDKAIQKAQESKRPYLEVDTLKWAAEKGDQAKFGMQTKIVGDKNAPIAFVLETGIRRAGDQGFTPHQEERPVEEKISPGVVGEWEVGETSNQIHSENKVHPDVLAVDGEKK